MIVPKWLAGTVVVALLVLAVLLWHQGGPKPGALNFTAPVAAQTAAAAPSDAPLVAPVSDVTPLDKEAKRFARYDKNKDGAITRDEFLATRRKAFAKLDLNHDGVLSFDEYSAKAIAKFDAADTAHTGKLTPAEFATTAVKHKPRTKAVCPPVATRDAPAADEPGETP